MANRTNLQNKALHLYFQLLADCLNDAGFSVMEVMRHDAEIPFTPELVKSLLWKPIQKAMTGEQSTADQSKTAYSDIEEVLARHLSEKLGIELPEWPSKARVDHAG